MVDRPTLETDLTVVTHVHSIVRLPACMHQKSHKHDDEKQVAVNYISHFRSGRRMGSDTHESVTPFSHDMTNSTTACWRMPLPRPRRDLLARSCGARDRGLDYLILRLRSSWSGGFLIGMRSARLAGLAPNLVPSRTPEWAVPCPPLKPTCDG